MQLHATAIFRSSNANALYQYMADCHFRIADVNASCLMLAMEYVYQPQPEFWRGFKIEDLLDAVTRAIPEWEVLLDPSAKSRMLADVHEILRINALDEENAQRLLSLPPAARPVDDESVSNWIFRELEDARRFDDLTFARRDGSKCGRQALAMLEILSADSKRPRARTGTLVARTYRELSMRRRGQP